LDSGIDLFRIGGLADALFAIVLTLLVLELRLPEASYTEDADLLAGYLSLVPMLYAYVLTFAVGSLHWIAHHRFVAHLARYDRGLIIWNLLFLGTVSGLPFTSSVVGKNGDLFLGWALYAAHIVLIGLAFGVLVRHASVNGLLRPDVSPSLGRFLQLRALGAPLVFGLSIPVALVSTSAAQFTPLLLLVYGRLVSGRLTSTSGDVG